MSSSTQLSVPLNRSFEFPLNPIPFQNLRNCNGGIGFFTYMEERNTRMRLRPLRVIVHFFAFTCRVCPDPILACPAICRHLPKAPPYSYVLIGRPADDTTAQMMSVLSRALLNEYFNDGWVFKGSGDLPRCWLGACRVAGAGRFRSAPGPIGVSLQPATPRRVAPQQSPPPLHRSLTMVADPARASNALAQTHCKDIALPWLASPPPGMSSLLCAPSDISILRRHP
jgi:hypothetical protein